MAVRFGCPIFTYDHILENAGILMDEQGNEQPKSQKIEAVGVQSNEDTSSEDLSRMSIEQLNILLEEVLENEDYIKAISIRDEIKRRK